MTGGLRDRKQERRASDYKAQTHGIGTSAGYSLTPSTLATV